MTCAFVSLFLTFSINSSQASHPRTNNSLVLILKIQFLSVSGFGVFQFVVSISEICVSCLDLGGFAYL